MKKFVPAGFILVYAPRTKAEVEIAMKIVRAAVWWVGGMEVGVQQKAGEETVEVKYGAVREREIVAKDWVPACPDTNQMIMS